MSKNNNSYKPGDLTRPIPDFARHYIDQPEYLISIIEELEFFMPFIMYENMNVDPKKIKKRIKKIKKMLKEGKYNELFGHDPWDY